MKGNRREPENEAESAAGNDDARGAEPATGSEEEASSAARSLLRSAGAVGLITLLSRITGVVRDNTQARFLGTGDAADAFQIALAIPNLFRRLVGEGAMASGLVPVLVSYRRQEDADALRILAEKFYTLWTIVVLAITLTGMSLAGWILGLELPGFEAAEAWPREKIELTIELTRWLFVYLFFISLFAVGQGILNALGLFALPAATPLIYNASFVAAGYLLSGVFPAERAPWSFVVGVLAGGTLQLVVIVPALWRRGLRIRPRWPGNHPGVREILRLLLPGTFGAGVYQLNFMVSLIIAGTVPFDGAVASLGYSSRLMEFALGVFVFALSTVGLTHLSRQVAAGDLDGVRRTTSQVLRLSWFITIPSAVGLLILGDQAIALLLKGGEFGDRSQELTLRAFHCHAPGLLFVGASRVFVSVFYAFKKVWVPVRLGVLNLIINAALCVLLSRTALEHAGIALAATLSAVVQALLLMTFLERRKQLLDFRELGLSLARAAGAAVGMAAILLVLKPLLPVTESRWLLGLEVFAQIAIGIGVYFAGARLLGADEVTLLLGRWWRRG